MNYDLCDKFIEFKKYMGYKYKTDTIVMNNIKKFLVDNKTEQITKEVVEKYARLNPNIKTNTLARNINVFREFCKYLKMQDIVSYQIPKKFYPQKSKQYIPYIFSDDEIKSILKNCETLASKGNYSYKRHIILPLIIRILYQTGMRIGEVLNLKVNNYNEEEGYFLIENSKNNSERIICLPNSLNEKILNYHKKFHYNTEDEYFFQITKTKINTSTIEGLFNKALILSNISKTDDGPVVHCLRHCFIIKSIKNAYEEGKDMNNFLPYLQAYVGHQSIKSLEYYFKLTKNMINDLNPIIEEKIGNIIPKLGDTNE